MSTLRGIYNQAQSMSYLLRLQEVTANNLANASTGGFKLDRVTGQQSANGEFPVPVQVTDLSQGPVRETGRPFDVALVGDGFLVVRTPAGERLTRGGSLRLDAAGMLVDGEGHAVLGLEGPIVAPVGELVIDADGQVKVDGTPVDRLRMQTVADPATLRKEGNGRFIADTPLQPATGLALRQGAIEDTNGDMLLGMVDLVTIQRAYAANADALKAMDGVLGTIAGEIGYAR